MDKEKNAQHLTKLRDVSQELIDALNEAGEKRNLCTNYLHEENAELAENTFSEVVEQTKKIDVLQKKWIKIAGTILREK